MFARTARCDRLRLGAPSSGRCLLATRPQQSRGALPSPVRRAGSQRVLAARPPPAGRRRSPGRLLPRSARRVATRLSPALAREHDPEDIFDERADLFDPGVVLRRVATAVTKV